MAELRHGRDWHDIEGASPKIQHQRLPLMVNAEVFALEPTSGLWLPAFISEQVDDEPSYTIYFKHFSYKDKERLLEFMGADEVEDLQNPNKFKRRRLSELSWAVARWTYGEGPYEPVHVVNFDRYIRTSNGDQVARVFFYSRNLEKNVADWEHGPDDQMPYPRTSASSCIVS
eukprot:TRINITY_DN1852_c0_g1_i1.p1 TRINITY_DN1852_c0_g1~~TRINITY_DN1852_c0_g1_i1.p1  ORF type:complete len:202 (-),score=17.87 TRINITY_DN1852_c0_g1_i1:122-637(-)